MQLKDCVAIVTGAGKGLGKAIAERFFQEGALLALFDIQYDLISNLGQELDVSGDKVIAIKADITDEENIKQAMNKVYKKFGKIDILVNNAGISLHKPIKEMSLEDFSRVINVNLNGTFICCKSVVSYMEKQKRGKIVNIASLAGRTGRPGVGVNYAASKAGVIGLTQTLARELGPSGIYVNSICPGPILTEQTKQYPAEVFASWNVGRAILKDGLPEDVADAAVFLSSNKSDWITGISLDVNGGILIR
ncbi:MAG: 3-oxoacyl-(Acyl-carrier-protein) reductase [candidate division TA06 bacterium 34_109]|uniref:3-oxoacyl-(Acyl-carrier-protein) reductase n=1 Tax=candidate division TA06 bacterium 34_109 TaxID=1635277 RepID=A0A101HYV6_UNCT6|nr:MAG: 3-oxoacyl-(Acyl-carrier-protein) reductase [candidate division TA06 bacterium 34_109]